MSNQPRETGASDGDRSVGDDELPEDLRPSEDNPLAQPAGGDVPDDILKETAGGKSGGRSGDKTDDDLDADPDGPDAGSAT